MTAFYNEIDPYAAQWLRNLIAAGHIAPGIVDERSIVDVQPDELLGYTQCHFFAGIGVWSLALRRSGWSDDRPIWTGSCPCQPFSAAGKGGGFDDERHLWPAFHWLIEQCRPSVVIGEQVASKDGLGWLDLVQADLQGTGYASAAIDLCAAGVGAPHIRQRLWWVGMADAPCEDERRGLCGPGEGDSAVPEPGSQQRLERGGASDGLDDDDDARLEGQRRGHSAEGGRDAALRSVAATGEPCGVEHTDLAVEADRDEQRGGELGGAGGDQEPSTAERRPRPTNGFWRDADWLFCRDGKWRPVEPGTFPLAHGAPARVGRLRAYGNAIVAPAAQVFIESVMEAAVIGMPITEALFSAGSPR